MSYIDAQVSAAIGAIAPGHHCANWRRSLAWTARR
jgi:hypothetical protein